MEKIKLSDYFKLTDERKKEIKQNILDNYKSLPKGLKISIAASNYDLDKIFNRTYNGYLAELKVLKHLQEKNPTQDWHFINDDAGYYYLTEAPGNAPDLINNEGITIEVKNYIIYNNTVYFISLYRDFDKLWAGMFHNADYLAIIDNNTVYICDKETFKNNVITEPNNFDPTYKTNWILTVDKTIQI